MNSNTVAGTVGWLAGVAVTPNTSGLPGIAQLREIVGAMMTVALTVSVLALLVAAIVWALGANSSNPHLAGRGEVGVLQVGSRKDSFPPDTWTESGQTPALRESSSSRPSAHSCLSGRLRCSTALGAHRGRSTPRGSPDLLLKGWAHVDRVIDDVQFPDLPVGSKRGHVHDIERCRSTGRQAPVEMEPETHRRLARLVYAAHHRLQRQVRLTRVGEQPRIEVPGRLGTVERGVDDAIVGEEADYQFGICGGQSAEVSGNKVLGGCWHLPTLARLDSRPFRVNVALRSLTLPLTRRP